MPRVAVFVARRWHALAGPAGPATVALGLLACLCTLLAVVGPRAAAQLRTGAFRQFVATAPAAAKTVVGSLDDSAMSTGQAAGLTAGQIERTEAELRRNLRGLPLAPAAADWGSLTTRPVVVTDPAPSAQAYLPPKLELSYRDTLASNVRVLAGRLPGGDQGSGGTPVLPAAVTEPTARRFGLAVGSRLALPGAGVVVAVTAIVQPRDPAAPFWTADPTLAAPQLVYVGMFAYWTGGVFIAAGAVSALPSEFDPATMQLSWTFPLELGQLTGAQASQLRPRLAGALATAGHLAATSMTESQCSGTSDTKPGQPFHASVHCEHRRLQVPVVISMSSGTPGLMSTFEAQAGSVGGVLDLLSVSLSVLAAAVVLLASWLLVEQRQREFALLRARGAGRRQIAGVVFGASALTVLPGAAAGAAIAVAVTPGAAVRLNWWLVGLVALASLAGPAAMTLRLHRGYAPAARPDAPPGRRARARRLILEAALVLGAAAGLIVLREQGLGNGDVYPSAAPVLLAIGVAVVVLRVYPLAVRGLLRLAGRRGSATSFLGLVRAGRVSASATLPVFAMVLALAVVSFAATTRGAVTRGEVAASFEQVGTDAVVTTAGPVSAALQRAVAAVPGVRHIVTAGLATGSLPRAGAAEFTVLLVNPAQYAAVRAAGPLPPVPAAFTAPAAAGPAPVLASPDRAEQLGRAPVTVLLNGVRLVRVRVVAAAPGMSAVTSIGGPGYLVLDRAAARGTAPPANALLIAGQGIDSAALKAAVARHAADASIVVRSTLLAGLKAAPLQHGAYLALALGGAAAVACGLLALLLSMLLSAPSRQLALARVAAMGLSAGQCRLVAMVEMLPQLLAVLAGGAATAAALGPLLGPALSLSEFTGSGASVPLRVEPGWLAVAAACLLVAAIVTLASETAVTGQNAARFVRMEW